MSKNNVFLSQEDILEVEVVGDQNAASVELMGRDMSVLLTRMRVRGKRALVLDTLFEIGAVDTAGRKLVVELGKHLDYDKLAMVGKGGVLRLGANLMLRAIGRGEKIHYFSDREEALAWLKKP